MDQAKYDAARSKQIALAFQALRELRALAEQKGMPPVVRELAHQCDADWRAIALEIEFAIDAPDREAA